MPTFFQIFSNPFYNLESSDMNPARIAELLEPFIRRRPNSNSPPPPNAPPNFSAERNSKATPNPRHSEPAKTGEEPALLSPAQLQSISTYIDILIRWNARINLTAIRDPEVIVTRHFGESLFAAAHLFPHETQVGTAALACPERNRRGCPAEQSSAVVTVADIGSGAGFPGLPIKLWAPTISLTLVESNHKKAAFLREVTRALTLTNVNIQNARAESLAASTFDVVTLRAVERFQSILPTAAALVAPSGRLALLLGASQEDKACASLPGFTWPEPIPLPTSLARVFLIGRRQGNVHAWTGTALK
jgi:16S rRNA (guanine527-N7)-methyltransferase